MECQPITIRFGEFVVDPADRKLHGPHGEIHVGGRAFDVLEALLAAEGRLVTKDQLFESVWNGLAVSDAALTSVIRDLRFALGDRDRDGIIKVVYGKGYRLDAGEVTSSRSAHAPARGPTRHQLRTSLAVLPFANLTGDAANDYLGDGMAEEVLDLLGASSGLRLSARASSFSPKVREMSSVDAAKALGVDAILEGSVRAAGMRLKIGVRLVDGTGGYVLWSQTFDREMDDIFAVQAEVANAVVDAIAEKLNPSIAPLPPVPERSTRHVEAYKLLLQSQWLAGRLTPAFLATAVGLCEQAIDLCPDFAESHARLAVLLVIANVHSDFPNPEELRRAEGLAEVALSLAPRAVSALHAKSLSAAIAGQLIDSDRYFRAVISERPNNGLFHLSRASFVTAAAGHLRAASPDASIVEALIPFHAGAATILAMHYAGLGENERAERYLHMSLKFGIPRQGFVYSETQALLHARNGRFGDAADTIAASLDQNGEAHMEKAVRLAYLAMGNESLRPTAIDAIAALHKNGIERLSTMMRKRLVLYYGQLDETDRAITVLADSVRDLKARGMLGAGWGYLWFEELRAVQRHPSFIPIARDLGFVEYWEVNGPPDGYRFDGEKLIPANEA